MGGTFTADDVARILNGLGPNGANGGSFYGSSPAQLGGTNNVGGYELSGTFDRFANTKLKKLDAEIKQMEKEIDERVRKNHKGWSEEKIQKEIANQKQNSLRYQAKVKDWNKEAKVANGMSFAYTFAKRSLALAEHYQAKEYKLFQAQLNTTANLTNQQIQLASQTFQGSFNTVLDTLNGNVMDIGKNALSSQLKMSKSFWTYERAVPLEMKKLQNQSIITNERWGQELLKSQNDLTSDVLAYGQQNLNANERAQVLSMGGEQTSAALQASTAEVEKIRQEVNLANESVDAFWGTMTTMRERAMSIDVETQEKLNEVAGKLYDLVNEVVEKHSEIAQITTKMLNEIDKESKDLALNFGFTGEQAQRMSDSFVKANVQAAKWGLEAKNFMEMQRGYMDSAGRQVTMNANDYDAMAAISRITGMSSEQTGQIMGEMNIFNTSVEHGADTIQSMYNLANKMGLSSKQYTKDLSQNLKLAQKYNFVGGSKELQKMSIWAQQVRMNLSTATQFAESMISGGIENTLEKAAHLQVLGGNAAIYSDPLGMMYDAGADVGNLARRMEAMLGNFGTFNRQTGETKFSWTDTKMIEEIAKAMGMERGEAMNVLREKNKFTAVQDQFVDNRFSEEEQRAISNRATYDEKSGKFKVSYINELGDKVTKDVSELTRDEFEKMMPQDNEEALVDFAQKSYGVEMKQLMVTKEIAARIGVNVSDEFLRLQAQKEAIIKSHANEQVRNRSNYYGVVGAFENHALENQFQTENLEYTSGYVDSAFNLAAQQLDKNLQRTADLNAEMQDVFRMAVGSQEEFYAAMMKFAELTGEKDLMERPKRMQSNLIDERNGISGGVFQNLLGTVRPNSNYSQGYGYGNQMAYQNFNASGGNAISGKTKALANANEVAFTNLTTALNNFASKPIQTNSSINMSGTLNLQQPNYGAANLISELQKNPALLNQFINLMAEQTSTNASGGKTPGSVPGAPWR